MNEPERSTTENIPGDDHPKKAGELLRARTPEGQNDIVRAELNIEKWPAIWKPSKSKNRPAVRIMEREVTLPGGGRVTARVELGYTEVDPIVKTIFRPQ